MKLKHNFYFLPLIFMLFVSACQNTETQQQAKQSVPNYQRIISLSPSTTEILFALGLSDKVIGVTRYCNYPPEARDKEKVGGYLDPNYEAIALLKPDVVIILPEHENVKEYLDQLSIHHFTVNNKTIADILLSIQKIGNLTNTGAKADSLVNSIQNEIDAISIKTKNLLKPKVMICIGRHSEADNIEDAYFAGRKTFYDQLIETAGGVNAIDKPDIAYPMISAEGIIACNPDIIVELFADFKKSGQSTEAVLNDWKKASGINAVENNRLHLLDSDYVFIPGPRFILLLKDLARIIHPEIDWNQQ